MSDAGLELFDFQKVGVAKILKHKYYLLADPMGFGKTIQALTAIKEAGKKTLIVCPAFLRFTWEDEAEKFYGKDFASTLTIISYSSFHRLKDMRYDFVVCDEAHYLKNPKAKRTQFFFSLIRKNRPEYLLLMTGTPIKNRVGEFWSLLQLLSLNPGPTNGHRLRMSHFEFQRHFSNLRYQKINGRQFAKFEGHRNIPELKQILIGKYLRRKSDAVELPPLRRTMVEFKPGKSKQEQDLEKAWEEYNSGKKSKHLSVVKAVTALAKVPDTLKYIQDIVDQDEQVVVFTDHVKVVEALAARSPTYRGITGSTSMDKRGEIIRQFQACKVQVICATIGALSTGVTLTAASNLIFNDYPWVPADLLQAEKRIHRIGQDKPCVIHMLFSGPIDRMIYAQLVKKLKTIKEVV